MINLNSEFEKRRADFETGIISEQDLSQEEVEKLTAYYQAQIASDRREIDETKYKIRAIKKKIDEMHKQV